MKNLFLSIFCLLICSVVIAQAPNKFRYQAVARDQSGLVITGELDLRLSFLKNSPNGSQSYMETHHVTTNNQGIFSITIGEGMPVSGSLSQIDWGEYNYWINVELKAPGANDFTEMGSSQLLSVPYAQYATHSGEKQTAGQGIAINNNEITNTGDLSNQNEIQTLNVIGNQLTISGGNTVSLPPGNTYAEGNGIQINGFVISADDPSATNELQTLSLNGLQLSLSNGGGTISLPSGGGSGWFTNGTLTSSSPIGNNVAIGTNQSANSRFHVVGDGSNAAGSFYSPGTGYALHAISDAGSAIGASCINGRGGTFTSTNDYGGYFTSVFGTGGYFSSTNGPALVTETGNVGLGVLNPARRLHVSGSTLLTNPVAGGVALEIGAGKVGIGITSPSHKFEVNGSSYFDNTGGPAVIIDHGNVGIGTANPAARLSVFGSGTSIIGSSTGGYGIAGYSEGNFAAGYFHANTGAAGFFNADNFFCILAHQGALGTPANSQGIALQFDGDTWKTYIDAAHDYNFAYGSALRAWILDTDGSYHNSSDRSLKKDIMEFSNVLPRLSKLQAYTYRMKNAPEDSPLSVGFMAQEVEAQFPQLVIEKEGYKSLCYDHFAVLSVEAIKEQQQEIESLRSKMSAMEKETDVLKAEMAEMKLMIAKLAGK